MVSSLGSGSLDPQEGHHVRDEPGGLVAVLSCDRIDEPGVRLDQSVHSVLGSGGPREERDHLAHELAQGSERPGQQVVPRSVGQSNVKREVELQESLRLVTALVHAVERQAEPLEVGLGPPQRREPRYGALDHLARLDRLGEPIAPSGLAHLG
jgi:hypothetical protein